MHPNLEKTTCWPPILTFPFLPFSKNHLNDFSKIIYPTQLIEGSLRYPELLQHILDGFLIPNLNNIKTWLEIQFLQCWTPPNARYSLRLIGLDKFSYQGFFSMPKTDYIKSTSSLADWALRPEKKKAQQYYQVIGLHYYKFSVFIICY